MESRASARAVRAARIKARGISRACAVGGGGESPEFHPRRARNHTGGATTKRCEGNADFTSTMEHQRNTLAKCYRHHTLHQSQRVVSSISDVAMRDADATSDADVIRGFLGTGRYKA